MNLRILFTILHDFIIFGLSFFIALWIRLDFANALILSKSLWPFIMFFSLSNIFLLKYMRLYHGIWRYASLHEIISIIKSVVISTLLLLGTFFLIFRLENIPRSFPILLLATSIFACISPRVLYRIIKDNFKKKGIKKIPIFVVGDNSTSENFIRLSKQIDSPYKVIGLISVKEKSVGRRIHNVPILCSLENLNNLVDKLKSEKNPPQRIIVSDSKIDNEFLESLYIFSKQNGLAIGMLPKISELSEGTKNQFETSPIVIEDVLGRKQKVNNPDILKDIKNKVVLVTGAGGSIGSELSRQIFNLKPKLLILLEQNEFNLFKISSELRENTIVSLTDIRDTEKMQKVLSHYKPHYVFHTAALKHITFVEDEPLEALETNFLSTVNLCQLCKKLKIKKFVFISTDKAVDPTNVMGASKRLCEKYIQKISNETKSTIFSIVRFGNVLGSTGSVVPLFEKQINNGGPITITHPKIKRYFMTIREAVELVLISSQLEVKENGEIFILEMGESIFIKDLAKRMIQLCGKKESDIEIKYSGLRKGEKIEEKLFFDNEIISKTKVPGILSTNSKLFSPKISDFQRLTSEMRKSGKKNVINYFEKLLPEYSKSE